MNNKYYIIIGILLLSLSLKAQIGVNTENPQTIFHIDVLKNNTGVTPSVAQQQDDVYFGMGLNNEAVISLGKIPETNTQLFLNDPNKAFLPNKVALKSQLDITTVVNPQIGMLVYNTATVAGTNGVIPGLYVYESSKWKYLFTEDTKKLQMRNLQTAITAATCNSINYSCATPMDFGDDILIPQVGAYGVGLSLYSRTQTVVTTPIREIVYVWLMANDVPVDVAELNIVGFDGGKEATYSVFLGGAFNAGDKLTCRISTNHLATLFMYLYPIQTFMMYWRLEQTSM